MKAFTGYELESTIDGVVKRSFDNQLEPAMEQLIARKYVTTRPPRALDGYDPKIDSSAKPFLAPQVIDSTTDKAVKGCFEAEGEERLMKRASADECCWGDRTSPGPEHQGVDELRRFTIKMAGVYQLAGVSGFASLLLPFASTVTLRSGSRTDATWIDCSKRRNGLKTDS